MNIKNKIVIQVALALVVILMILWFLKDVKLSWVEVNETYAEITINFLVPMEKDMFTEHLRIVSELPYAQNFEYTLTWLTDRVVSIKIKETNAIKGQKVRLFIQEAPSQYTWITKTAKIPIQFKAPIEIISPMEELLIASNHLFTIRFNTPIDKKQIYKFLECDAVFYITPGETIGKDGQKIEDTTYFTFTPKEPLENGKKYIMSFRAGMPSKGGTLLSNNQSVILKVDTKPIIKSTYPQKGDKWIGLYPRLTLESETPIIKATLTLEGNVVEGKLIDDYHAFFILKDTLSPEKNYEAVFQTEAMSGELSLPWPVTFTTTTLNKERVWLEVVAGENTVVRSYKGEKLIKTMVCSLGKGEKAPLLGTYYLQDKQDVFTDNKNKEGANFWLKINDTCGFQGLVRDEYWQIKSAYKNQLGKTSNRSNIILSEEDAKWLYENVPVEAMIVIRKDN